MTSKMLRRFAEFWVLGFLTLLVISVGRQVLFLAPSVEQGLADVQMWFDPTAPQTYVIPLLLISPAVVALYLSFRSRSSRHGK